MHATRPVHVTFHYFINTVPVVRPGLPDFDSQQGHGPFSSPVSKATTGAHAASYSTDTRALSLLIKRLERDADHAPPPSADDKNASNFSSTPSYAFKA
jgi:hypothetical protein